MTGSHIQTASGICFDPLDPRPDLIEIGDIARALSNQCRFGGHCERFYSVAQHCVLMADVAADLLDDPVAPLWALLHDASEAYLVDLPYPVKHNSDLGSQFRVAEQRVLDAVMMRYDLPLDPPSGVKVLDRRMLATESRIIHTAAWNWSELDGIEPLDIDIDPWMPGVAYDAFLASFDRYAVTAGALAFA
jgi:hypothetical protein